MTLRKLWLIPGAAALVSSWKFAVAPMVSAREWGSGQEVSANTYVTVTRTDPGNITCGSATSSARYVFNDLWLLNGNPGNSVFPTSNSNWIEVGTSYCDQYKDAAHYVFARSQGSVYTEYQVSGYMSLDTNFKLTRASATDQTYTAYISRPGQAVIQAGTQYPSVNEVNNYGGNWSMVGTEVQNRTGATMSYVSHHDLKYATGPAASGVSWSGRDFCVQTSDPTTGYWYADDHWKSRRLSDADVAGC